MITSSKWFKEKADVFVQELKLCHQNFFFLPLLVLPLSVLAFFSAMIPPCSGSTLPSYILSNSSEKEESSLPTFPTKILDSTLNDLALVKSPPLSLGEDMIEGKVFFQGKLLCCSYKERKQMPRQIKTTDVLHHLQILGGLSCG